MASGFEDAIALTTIALEATWGQSDDSVRHGEKRRRLREYVDAMTDEEARVASMAGALLFAATLKQTNPTSTKETLCDIAIQIAQGFKMGAG